MQEHNAAKAEAKLAEECTFQPDTVKPRYPGSVTEPSRAKLTQFKADPDYMMARIRQYLSDKEK